MDKEMTGQGDSVEIVDKKDVVCGVLVKRRCAQGAVWVAGANNPETLYTGPTEDDHYTLVPVNTIEKIAIWMRPTYWLLRQRQ